MSQQKPRPIEVYDGDGTDSLAEVRDERLEREARHARAQEKDAVIRRKRVVDTLARVRPRALRIGCARFDINWDGKLAGRATLYAEDQQADDVIANAGNYSEHRLTQVLLKPQRITSLSLRTPGWDAPDDPYRIAIETILVYPWIDTFSIDGNEVSFRFKCRSVKHIKHANKRNRAKRLALWKEYKNFKRSEL